MDPDSLDSQIMAHEGCDEMEDEGEKELPDLGLGANVVHDSDDEDNAEMKGKGYDDEKGKDNPEKGKGNDETYTTPWQSNRSRNAAAHQTAR